MPRPYSVIICFRLAHALQYIILRGGIARPGEAGGEIIAERMDLFEVVGQVPPRLRWLAETVPCQIDQVLAMVRLYLVQFTIFAELRAAIGAQ